VFPVFGFVPAEPRYMLIGIDTGGTFTDFVLVERGLLRVHKVLSTPRAPEQAILQGIREMGLRPAGLRVIHGSTVATNAALEGKGVRTAYVGNRGLGDLLGIGRQARGELYELQPGPRLPPVPDELCLETGGRLAADGGVVDPLTEADLATLGERLRRLAPRSVAINLLFSYLDDAGERALEAAVPPGIFVSRSSEVLPVAGEYERGIATWLNAWLGPLVEGYIRRLGEGLAGASVGVMQSSGEAIAAAQAASQSVRMLLSGPAGGMVGARFVGRQAGCERMLTFDMGGTSTDVALIDGEPRLTSQGRIGPWPVAVPMVDLHTIGAGGGSIARVDAGGMLLVGPESAGADPGPACYGSGGTLPTVTDANLVLGRLSAEEFLGGRMALDRGAAVAALGRVAEPLGLSPEQAAAGVIRVANEHMARALRVISVQRGVDPRGFTLVSFGGAGSLHVCALAEALGMGRAMVPVQSGVLSALGMLAARPGRRLSRTWLGLLQQRDAADVQQRLQDLAEEGRQSLVAEGADAGSIDVAYSLDLRYRGQSYTLELPWRGCTDTAAKDFSALHRERYGHRLELPVELVNLRAAVSAPAARFQLAPAPDQGGGEPLRTVAVFGIEAAVPLYRREALPGGAQIQGPAILVETVATTWLAPGWRCRVDRFGNLLLERRR
jgi:N-methylhydantoinase A